MRANDTDAIKAAHEKLSRVSQETGGAMYEGAGAAGAGSADAGSTSAAADDDTVVDAEVVDEGPATNE